MNESILTSVKKIIGIQEEYEVFDADLIMHINTTLFELQQIGVGKVGFSISDKTATWDDFVGDSRPIESIKTFTALKVRLIFDPPQNSNVTNSLEKVIKELEYRIYTAMEFTFDNQLSIFATKEELDNKVDKEDGKSLMDDSEIERLKDVRNYDDTDLRNEIPVITFDEDTGEMIVEKGV